MSTFQVIDKLEVRMLQFTGRCITKDNERFFEMTDGSLRKPTPAEPTELVVVWHGALPDPLGFGKGILLDPRTQTEDERLRGMPRLDDGGPDTMTLAELNAAIERLNASLKNPLDLSKPPSCWRRGVERPL